jgi:hypothetical protein
MLNKLYAWVGKHSLYIGFIVFALLSVVTIYNLVDVVRRPASIKVSEGTIQNHLVWSNKGECFFVRPYTDEVFYLIRVNDCDKK